MAHMEAPSERVVLKKKEKQQMKHDAFLQRKASRGLESKADS